MPPPTTSAAGTSHTSAPTSHCTSGHTTPPSTTSAPIPTRTQITILMTSMVGAAAGAGIGVRP